jgi:tripartite-type tricarboxylate transporter receptor subunit TctC
MRLLIRSGLAVATVLGSVAVLAQDGAATYPTKPIRIVVTFPAGGPSDIISRAIGQKLTQAWGQPVIVDNRPGAGGNIGMDLVAKAAPDGYTLAASSFGPLIISPFVYSRLSYDPVRDLTPVTLAATSWFFVVVHPSVAATTLKELVALAKDKPGQLTYASSGNATPSHLAGALLQSVAGINLTHVPYKGGATSIPAVIAGEVQIAIETPSVLIPHVKTGKLRALAVASPHRSPLLPDLPNVREAGLPGCEVGSWYGYHAPAGTPRSIVDKLNAGMVKAMNTPELRERFAGVGSETVADTPAEYGAFVAAELKKWEKVIRATGVKVE